MAHYLEYEKSTGRIISEIVSATPPEMTEPYGLFEIGDDVEINTALYAIRNGSLVKLYETNEERLQREQLRRENQERVRERIKSMMFEVCIALLDDNEKALKNLKAEYKEIKGYL